MMSDADKIRAEISARLQAVPDAELEIMARRVVRDLMSEINRRGRSLTLHSEEFAGIQPAAAE